MNTFFKNIDAKNKAIALYHKKLDQLNLQYESTIIETSFGDTHVLISGAFSQPPLILLHGSNGCAPIAIEALIELTKDFRIYAIDVVGQPNLSEETRPNMTDDSYGQWMYEIMTRLNIWNAILVGISFGGFIAWKTLVFDEKRMAKSFFITPAGIVNGNLSKILWNIFLPMQRYKRSGNKKHLLQFTEAIFSQEDEFFDEFLANIIPHYELDLSHIPLIKKGDAQKIKTPIYFIAANDDLLFPGRKLLAQAKNIFPSLVETLLLKNSKHVPSKSDYNQIVEFIKKSK
ncbi:MAG: alpha/beta hydrolase [Saprospiraceae bacterium]